MFPRFVFIISGDNNNSNSKDWNSNILDLDFLHQVKRYMFKVSSRNLRKGCEICSTITMKTLEQHHGSCSGVFIVNFGHISQLF